ncbi:MAG TPA: dolichol kinase, partial [Pyrodictium sp.]|nr:dolichol kinase [Pyrodictium sp.]
MLLVEAGWAIALLAYVMAVVVGTKALYDIMRKHGLPHNVAVYYNRKAIHVLAGGVVALLVPLLFSEPWIPFVLALVLALLTY